MIKGKRGGGRSRERERVFFSRSTTCFCHNQIYFVSRSFPLLAYPTLEFVDLRASSSLSLSLSLSLFRAPLHHRGEKREEAHRCSRERQGASAQRETATPSIEKSIVVKFIASVPSPLALFSAPHLSSLCTRQESRGI